MLAIFGAILLRIIGLAGTAGAGGGDDGGATWRGTGGGGSSLISSTIGVGSKIKQRELK